MIEIKRGKSHGQYPYCKGDAGGEHSSKIQFVDPAFENRKRMIVFEHCGPVNEEKRK